MERQARIPKSMNHHRPAFKCTVVYAGACIVFISLVVMFFKAPTFRSKIAVEDVHASSIEHPRKLRMANEYVIESLGAARTRALIQPVSTWPSQLVWGDLSAKNVSVHLTALVKLARRIALTRFTAVTAIIYEGSLPSSPGYNVSKASTDMLPGLLTVAVCSKAINDTNCTSSVIQGLQVWATTYKPTGNPINENLLIPWIRAYDLMRMKLAQLLNATAITVMDNFLMQIIMKGDSFPGNIYFKTWRLSIRALASVTLANQTLISSTKSLIDKHIPLVLYPNGSSYEFIYRDALFYHVYALDAWLHVAVQAPVTLSSRPIALIEAAVWFLKPYYTGEKVHIEFLYTTASSDKFRKVNNLSSYQNVAWNPSAGVGVISKAGVVYPSVYTWALPPSLPWSNNTLTKLLQAAWAAHYKQSPLAYSPLIGQTTTARTQTTTIMPQPTVTTNRAMTSTAAATSTTRVATSSTEAAASTSLKPYLTSQMNFFISTQVGQPAQTSSSSIVAFSSSSRPDAEVSASAQPYAGSELPIASISTHSERSSQMIADISSTEALAADAIGGSPYGSSTASAVETTKTIGNDGQLPTAQSTLVQNNVLTVSISVPSILWNQLSPLLMEDILSNTTGQRWAGSLDLYQACPDLSPQTIGFVKKVSLATGPYGATKWVNSLGPNGNAATWINMDDFGKCTEVRFSTGVPAGDTYTLVYFDVSSNRNLAVTSMFTLKRVLFSPQPWISGATSTRLNLRVTFNYNTGAIPMVDDTLKLYDKNNVLADMVYMYCRCRTVPNSGSTPSAAGVSLAVDLWVPRLPAGTPTRAPYTVRMHRANTAAVVGIANPNVNWAIVPA